MTARIDRRRVLAGMALAGAGLAAPLPLLAANTGRARIAKVEAFAVPRAVFVKLTADDGTTGWGEAGHSGGKLVAQVIRSELASIYQGADVFDGDALWAKAYYEIDELGPGGLASQALAGVDCALWDLRGKLLGLPVWALLGGQGAGELPGLWQLQPRSRQGPLHDARRGLPPRRRDARRRLHGDQGAHGDPRGERRSGR